MYIQINDELIDINFSPFPKVKVYGPDLNYLVELREYRKGEDHSSHIQSHKITTSPEEIWRKEFTVPIEFYGEWEVIIYKFVLNYGLQKIYAHRFNDAGQMVLFNLDTHNFDEASLWADRIKEYERIHMCKPTVVSRFEEIDKMFPSFYKTSGIEYYKTYNIGRFPKQSTDFKTRDHRKHGKIWYGNWKVFWSYEHPRNWTNLDSKEIVDDILGL
jgi:hypothetical protein